MTKERKRLEKGDLVKRMKKREGRTGEEKPLYTLLLRGTAGALWDEFPLKLGQPL